MAVSATAALFGEDIRLGLPPVFSSSSGAAVRDTVAGATEHAVLELTERDAVAIWWYNRLTVPRLSAEESAAALPPDLAAWLAARRRLTWHLTLPTDLPVAVAVALSARADGGRPALGAAAGWTREAAVLSATLEMLQGEISLAHMRAAQRSDAPPPVPPLLAWSETTDALRTPELAGTPGALPPPPPGAFHTLAAALADAGIDVLVADITRAALGVPCVRALSPQLRDWLPRFGPGRLTDLPVRLGLRRTPLAEADLNPVPFVI